MCRKNHIGKSAKLRKNSIGTEKAGKFYVFPLEKSSAFPSTSVSFTLLLSEGLCRLQHRSVILLKYIEKISQKNWENSKTFTICTADKPKNDPN
jgi:hypothetical protein